ncbi:alpha/beta fold hydrolase [Shewanella sp. JL219SE-S6]
MKLETLPGGRPAGPLYQQSGNAGAFLDFLDQELNPWLNARLGQPGPTVLIGHSFGGLLALEALRRQQPMFNAYLVLDASLWYDSPTYADELEQALTQGKLTGKPLYMAISNQATTPDLAAMTTTNSEIWRWPNICRRCRLSNLYFTASSSVTKITTPCLT